MSKICHRDYRDNSFLSVKKINGLDCCTLCKKPAICHGKPVLNRALFWSMAGDTGVSSETLANYMIGYPPPSPAGPPSDADDRRRCIRLLELIPEWIPRLKELAINEKPRDGVVISSSGISANESSWAEQIPLIIKEGRL